MQSYLRDTLGGRYGLWGFKDLRVTRLLPFWQQVFDEMGLRPSYVWAVRDPAQCAASAVASGLVADPQIAEAMWFIYNADAHKYVGDQAVAIVDYAAWGEEPAAVVEMLLGRLPLSWRGSQAELLECLRAITLETRARGGASSPIHSPLVQAFYEAIRDPERTDKSLRTRDSVAQAVDILRTLIAPFAVLASSASQSLRSTPELTPPARPAIDESGGAPAIDTAEISKLRVRAEEAEAALAAAANRAEEAEAALAAAADRAAEAEAVLAARTATADQAEAASREAEEALSRELEERVAENGWLQQQFQDQKRALALLEEQRQQAAAHTDTGARRMLQRTEQLDRDLAEARERSAAESVRMLDRLGELERELAQQRDANDKYLSRIYELKGAKDAPGDPRPATASA